MQLHIPSSVHCPTIADPMAPFTSAPVPYAAALQHVRATQQLQTVVGTESEFCWLDQGNNSASTGGKIAELSKQAAAKFNFMYFRIRVADYHAALNSLTQVAKSESLFSEEKLRKWTIGYRFRLLKGAPIKSALRAFSCRMGIETDPDIVFCRDGFFGDNSAGSLTSSTGIPHQMLLGDVTAQGSGLTNGSSIFVSRTSQLERDSAAAVLRVVDEEPMDEGEGEGGDAAIAVSATDSSAPLTSSASPEKSAD